MSYRVRYAFPDGRAGHWMQDYATCEDAQRAIDERRADTGLAYDVDEVIDVPPKPKPTSTTERLVGLIRDRHAKGLAKYGTTLDRTDLTPEQWAQHAIEEALDLAGYLMRFKDGFGPEPGSTAAHHVEILRARVKELEEVQKAMHRDLLFALEIGQAMREAMRTGEWRAGHDKSMANSAMAGWDRWKTSLANAPSVPVGASEAPREGGDSDRRRLEALERWLRSKEDVSIVWMENRCLAMNETGLAVDWGWSLAALADKLAEKEGKP